MRRALSLLVLSALIALPGLPAAAQGMERMMVTANRVDESARVRAPAVYRQIPADFVMVALTYQSATRDTAERRKELETMFNKLKAKANTTAYFSLAGERSASQCRTSTRCCSRMCSRPIIPDRTFTLTLSIDTREGESFEALMKRADQFVKSIETSGRAEAWLGDSQFIGARDVAKHRADLVADIATEVRGLRDLFAPARVTLTGLESRIITQPSGPLVLEIFIPYTLRVESGE